MCVRADARWQPIARVGLCTDKEAAADGAMDVTFSIKHIADALDTSHG
jgi:hypothetical protein